MFKTFLVGSYLLIQVAAFRKSKLPILNRFGWDISIKQGSVTNLVCGLIFIFGPRKNFSRISLQAIGRFGLTYYLNDNTKLTAGYAYVNHFPADAHKNISQPEHRPWQQLQWHTRYQKLRLMQWIRLEERFRRKIKNDDELGEGHNFNWKVRYNFFVTFPLAKKPFAPKTWSVVLNDEVHINAGKEIVNNYFDQNRFFAGFSYHVNAHDNIQIGYMNLFQQLAAGNRYRSIHAARVFYFHNLDTRSNAK